MKHLEHIDFGIPELKKYPRSDEAHVLSRYSYNSEKNMLKIERNSSSIFDMGAFIADSIDESVNTSVGNKIWINIVENILKKFNKKVLIINEYWVFRYFN